MPAPSCRYAPTSAPTCHSPCLRPWSFEHYFKSIVGGGLAQRRRNRTAAHLLTAIEAAGGDPARAIMVGDSASDAGAARGAGTPLILVTFGYTEIPVQDSSGRTGWSSGSGIFRRPARTSPPCSRGHEPLYARAFRRLGDGRVAQRESACFTRRMSLVRSQPRPPFNPSRDLTFRRVETHPTKPSQTLVEHAVEIGRLVLKALLADPRCAATAVFVLGAEARRVHAPDAADTLAVGFAPGLSPWRHARPCPLPR